ncbi:MAG TPA: M1 family metallopeptidase, partial [Gemmatimonadales bacterium]|nr:M1 family metallopeptidase [Gemmatimonadales bacterium]
VRGGEAPYWQQRLEYTIAARLDESSGVLGGTAHVFYHNNSPDTLSTVSFHLYLNAFRPGSRWADADSAEHRRRFNDLRDPDYGFNRIRDVEIMGARAEAVYPFAPDSTVVRFALPAPAAPGDTFGIEMNWEARPSTVPRRQGRRGRHYDFAQWYPRVVAYDKFGWEEHPLYPAGEFYGDFGDFVVVLDLPEDQVVGATGVPLCGDPGWERANQDRGRPVDYRRGFYGAPGEAVAARMGCGESGGAPPGASPGRKFLVWYARDVHHFALSMSPDYRYEGGRIGGVAVHVLYQPGDEQSWGGGIAVRNTAIALGWLGQLFGPFPWPQLTNVHRIEGGGTEYPMMVHDGSAGLGLILHEVGHNYLMGVLANNEWKEGFLDEGFTSFQTTWFEELFAAGQPGSGGGGGGETRGAGRRGRSAESAYPALEREILLSDLDGRSEPTSLVSERYRDFGTYNEMIYNRGELFYHQLRAMVGDSVMRLILRTYYDRWKLKHVDEAAFRSVAEEVSKRDLSTFFGQWLHGTELYDYAVGRVKSVNGQRSTGNGRAERRNDGKTEREWLTRVEVVRKAPGIFPVEVVARSRTDSAVVRADGAAEREWVELVTREKPREIEIDPAVRSHDWNTLNNRKRRGLLGFRVEPRRELYLDRLFSDRVARDRLTVGLIPTLWYNDAGGVSVGGRMRSDYLGRFEQSVLSVSVDTRQPESSEDHFAVGIYARLRNPVRLYLPRTTQTFEGYRVEGRSGLAASVEREKLGHQGFGPETHFGGSLRWLATNDTDFLDPALWDAGGTVEASWWVRSAERRGAWTVAGRLGLGGGVQYRNLGAGLTTGDRYDAQPYFRGIAEATVRRTFGGVTGARGARGSGPTGLALRLFGGWVESGDPPLKQRQLFLAGADPYQQLANPFLRSRGALLAGSDVHYRMPGGGGVRGLAVGASATRLLAVNAELDRAVLVRGDSAAAARAGKTLLFHEVRVAAFGDAALGDGDILETGEATALVADAGIGLRIGHRIGQTPFVTRFDLPFYVSRSRLAVNAPEGQVRFRWVVSFGPAI